MDNSIELLKNRRSCRKYLDKEVPQEVLVTLIDCARLAPFGGKPIPECQVTEFIVVNDNTIKEKLALQYEDRQFIKQAPTLIAVLANKQNDPKYKEYVISASLSIQNLLLAAESLGIGACILSCFMNHEGHKEEKEVTRNILRLPSQIELIALITLGYKDKEEVIPKKTVRELSDSISYNYYLGESENELPIKQLEGVKPKNKNYCILMLFSKDAKKVLLVKRKKEPYLDCWNGIGGKIEQRETSIEAAIRETKEETGIQLLSPKLLYTCQYPKSEWINGGTTLHVIYDFIEECVVEENEEGIYEWKPVEFVMDSQSKKIAGFSNLEQFVKEIYDKEEIQKFYEKKKEKE